MTARVTQLPLLVLSEKESDARVTQNAVLVLRGERYFASSIVFDYDLEEPAGIVADITFDYAINAVDLDSFDFTFDYSILDTFASDIGFNYALQASLSADAVFDYRILESYEKNITFDYVLQAQFEAEITFDYVLFEIKESRLTQLPVITVDASSQQVRITQLPVISVVVAEQNTRLTQLPLSVPTIYRPVALPVPMIPRAPVTEVWAYLTVLQQARGSKEQRSRLRETPRYSIRFDFALDTEEKRRQAYDILYKYQGRYFPYPMFHHFAHITQVSLAGTNRLYFDPASTDLRVGENVAIFSTWNMSTVMYGIQELHADGATLTSNLEEDVTPVYCVAPVANFRLPSPYSLSMSSDVGEATIRIESAEDRQFQRVESSHLLTMLDGLPLITDKFLDDAEELLDFNTQWRDNDTSIPSPNNPWRSVFTEGMREWVFDRQTGMDYWRAFIDYTKGRQKPFYLATFWDDLPLAEIPAPGATEFVTSNVHADRYLNQRNCRHVRIESEAGVFYRRVNYRILNYDDEGYPISVTVRLNGNIGGSTVIKRISFVNKVRLNTDNIMLQHYTGHSTIRFDVRAVNE